MPKSLVPHPGDDTWRLEMCGEAVWKLYGSCWSKRSKLTSAGKSNTNNFFFVSQIFID